MYRGKLRDVTIQERGARTGLADLVTRDLELADDLTLLANSAEDIRVFLNRLHAYAIRKRLIVNAEKRSWFS